MSASAPASGPRIAVFGLGEAGGCIAADLVDRGAQVHAFDPASRPTPAGVTRHEAPSTAVQHAVAVLAVTAAADAETAVLQALDDIPVSAVYADLSTASAEHKRRLARLADRRSLAFADVALMSTVPGSGLATPQLASGAGAAGYVALVRELGAQVEVIGEQPGDAATRKLLRSVVTKGLAALLIEVMRAATEAGLAGWAWEHLTSELTTLDEAFLRRLVEGTAPHAERRLHEMEAVSQLLTDLGVEPRMTNAIVDSLRAARTHPPPALPDAGP
jgi:3-hydroxyisobutyrate dehydrogenase-like beta-hydroxyacid dehydrogenase